MKRIRKELHKKVLFIRRVSTVGKLLFAFFPDLYVHDIEVEKVETQKRKIFKIYLLTWDCRGIALGRGGSYIKAINEIFSRYITIEDAFYSFKLNCDILLI
ncbi:MAG: hypothetical protein GF383_02805 [Candidatus Lokiarchaeota archaeon]|nr:hypothetical protein [Candidatus Lokiarchaeota archaeon]MBD3338419.1 hypothetical protein [Candidatus Lokiarchaeota archaeon]